MNTDWEGVRDRLERLRHSYTKGPASPVFGAESHRFQALPPLSEADLAEAENQFSVTLPEDYRAFLSSVSAGGAGPHYGLFSLTRNASGYWNWNGDGAEMIDLKALNMNFDPGDVSDTLVQLELEQPPVDQEAAYDDWVNRCEQVLWAEHRTRGAICLCHQGCAYRDWLVLTGPHRGQMWNDERAGDVDLAPSHSPGGTAHTFGSWYLTWLLNAERKVLGPESPR